jgi:hypothetical protein
MNRRAAGFVLAFLLAAVPGLAQLPPATAGKPGPAKDGKATAKEVRKAPTTRELLAWLEEPLETKPYQVKLSLKELLKKFSDAFAAKGKELPVVVDDLAFKEETPDAPWASETELTFPSVPRRMPLREALRFAISKIPLNNGTFLVRRGRIEITTLERGDPLRLLQERISARFERRPLAEVLEELSDQTGASIILDVRVGEKAKTPVTATFRNTISLEGAIKLLAEMADLVARTDEHDVLFITNKSKVGPLQQGSALRLRVRPLHLALKDLSRWSKTRIVLDPRLDAPLFLGPDCWLARALDGPAMTSISVTFEPGFSPKVAARILAEMGGLTAVVVDDTIYVTRTYWANGLRGTPPAKATPAQKPQP